MKLTAKQLKNLSDNDFGIIDSEGKRSFPLCDERHVRMAIQMFKYCPKGKEAELAKNINRKAKEYGMKMNIKGSFLKYADKDIIGISKEASNVGTLEPIVAGADNITFPKLDDENASPGQKVLSMIAQKKIVAEAVGNVWRLHIQPEAMKAIKSPDNTPAVGPNTSFLDFDRYVNAISNNIKIHQVIRYMTDEWTDKNLPYIPPENQNDMYDLEAADRIYEIIDNPYLDTKEKISHIANVIVGTKPENLIYYMKILYNRDDKLCLWVINYLSDHPERPIIHFKEELPKFSPDTKIDDGELDEWINQMTKGSNSDVDSYLGAELMDNLCNNNLEGDGSLDDFIADNLDDVPMDDLVESMIFIFNKALENTTEKFKRHDIYSPEYRQLNVNESSYKAAFNNCLRAIKKEDPSFDFKSTYESTNAFSLVDPEHGDIRNIGFTLNSLMS